MQKVRKSGEQKKMVAQTIRIKVAYHSNKIIFLTLIRFAHLPWVENYENPLSGQTC